MLNRLSGKLSRYLLISLSLLLILTLLGAAYSWYINNDSLRTRIFTNRFHDKEILSEEVLELMASDSVVLGSDCYPDLNLDKYSREGIYFYCILGDSLEYWSANYVPLDIPLIKGTFNNSTVFLKNGYYFLKKTQRDERLLVSLIGIYHEYKYKNDYLKESFFDELPLTVNVSFNTSSGNHTINSINGNVVGSLEFDPQNEIQGWPLFILFAVFLAFILLLEKTLYHAYERFNLLKSRIPLLFILFLIDVLIIRAVIYFLEVPKFLFTSSIFDPYGFSSSLVNPSIGDAIINSFMLLMVSYLFYSKFPETFNFKRLSHKVFAAIVSISIVFVLFRMLISFVHNLVLNSSFSFNLQTIYSLDIQSLLGIILISTSTLSFVFGSLKILRIVNGFFNLKQYFIIVLPVVLLLTVSEVLIYSQTYTVYLLLSAYIISSPVIFRSDRNTLNFSSILYLLFLFSFLLNLILNSDNSIKEKQYRTLLMSELSTERDPWLEFEFSSLSSTITSDTTLISLLREGPENKFYSIQPENYLTDKYFKPFQDKYNIQVTFCRNDEVLEIQPEGFIINCFDYFDTLVSGIGEKTLTDNLFFLKDESESHNYLAIIPIEDTTTAEVNIYVELYSRIIPEEGLGYPDLLLDKESNFISDLTDYSYARYRNGILSYKFGDFPFSIELSELYDGPEEEIFFDFNYYNHLLKKIGPDDHLIISKQHPDLLKRTAPFSYLFIVFVSYLLIFIIFTLSPGGFKNLRFHFRDRLQFAVIVIILVSFVIIGIVSRIYIVKLNEDKNSEVLKEKTLSVLIELEHKLAGFNDISEPGDPYLEELLYKFSLVFFSDINLYDTNGYLVVSSRPEIFEAGLISNKINPLAFSKMKQEGVLEFIHNENIGKQEYLSSYMPFRNNNDDVIAFLNLPYFSKQQDLQREISNFLIAYINIYILTIIFTIITTLVVSEYVTRPLEFIRNKMRNISLGDPDAKIIWKHEDEIGSLVNEYNRMIDVIAESAEKLARSERETAWREMAQQVAHEIKNPLTPMKLNVQHLKKAWDEKVPGWQERLERFTKNMIEQIDSLSEIASAFSDFAKMPGSNISKIDLHELAKQAIELYGEMHDLTITFKAEGGPPFMIKADKKEILRVFNNLIRNSLQAISGRERGRVDIRLFSEEGYHVIEISDNGVGITEEQAEKIFRPSFTTKSGGMGLGLAIVHNIVVNSGGEITFNSVPGKGTSFYVKLPVLD